MGFFSSEKGGSLTIGGKPKGIGYGKRHKGKTTGGIGKTRKVKIPKVKVPKVKKVKPPQSLATLKRRKTQRGILRRKDKRIARRVWRKLI